MSDTVDRASGWPSPDLPEDASDKALVASGPTWPQLPPARSPVSSGGTLDVEVADNPWASPLKAAEEDRGNDDEPPDPVPGEPGDAIDGDGVPHSAHSIPDEEIEARDTEHEPEVDEPAQNYSVGYRRPPQHSQFKKGQSGNRNGRPRRPKSLVANILREMDAKVTINESGRTRSITKREAIAKRVVNSAVSGDIKAIESLAKSERANPPIEPFEVVEADDAVLKKFLSRKLNRRTGDSSEGSDT